MQDTPTPEGPLPQLRLLRLLVTVLTATLIIGLVVIVAVIVIRFPKPSARQFTLPDQITLPAGVHAIAVTAGPGWYAIVTDSDEILIHDAATGQIRQRVAITN